MESNHSMQDEMKKMRKALDARSLQDDVVEMEIPRAASWEEYLQLAQRVSLDQEFRTSLVCYYD